MRKWAKWMVRHNMRWVVYFALILSIIPISLFFIIGTFPETMVEIWQWIKHDWIAIGKEKPLGKRS